MRDGLPVGYLYREKPDASEDSGWRVFSGDETQQYANDPRNFAFYNVTTLLELEPVLKSVLTRAYPVAFERLGDSGEFVEVDFPEDD